MNEKIKEHLINACKKEGIDSPDDSELWEALTECGKEIHEESLGNSRWWENTFVVVELDGMLIGYYGAKTTGDDSPWDKGWEWDLDTVCEVEKTVEIVEVVKYKSLPAT